MPFEASVIRFVSLKLSPIGFSTSIFQGCFNASRQTISVADSLTAITAPSACVVSYNSAIEDATNPISNSHANALVCDGVRLNMPTTSTSWRARITFKCSRAILPAPIKTSLGKFYHFHVNKLQLQHPNLSSFLVIIVAILHANCSTPIISQKRSLIRGEYVLGFLKSYHFHSGAHQLHCVRKIANMLRLWMEGVD